MAAPSLRFVFGSDLHGVPEQFRKLVDRALATRAAWIFLGGDLHPDGSAGEQARFAREEIFPLLERARREGVRTAAILGNHEWSPVEAAWRARPDVAHLVHGIAVPLDERFAVAGCPVVPFTPWYVKDYERWDDRVESPEVAQRRLLFGHRTVNGEPVPYDRRDAPPSDTVADHLEALLRLTDPKRTVYLLHAPPYDSALDVMHGGEHIGSRAVRDFCKAHEPYLTLHGHIHETVDLTGRFRERWGEGMSASSGNDPSESVLAVVEGDLYDREGLRREMVRG